MTQNHVIVFLIFFNSYRFLRWWAPCRQEMWFFPALCGCESILSRVNRYHRLFSLVFVALSFAFISYHVMFLSFCIHFLSCCIHFLSFYVHVLSCSVPMYQRYRSSKVNILKPVMWVSSQTPFFFAYVVLLSLNYRFGGLCRLPPSGFMNMCMYKLVFWAGNAPAKLK